MTKQFILTPKREKKLQKQNERADKKLKSSIRKDYKKVMKGKMKAEDFYTKYKNWKPELINSAIDELKNKKRS